jgi:hypothetical protein
LLIIIGTSAARQDSSHIRIRDYTRLSLVQIAGISD